MRRWGYTPLLLLVLFGIVVALGYNAIYQPFKDVVFGEIVPTPTPLPSPTIDPASLVAPKDKIAAMLALPVTVPGASLSAAASFNAEPQFITLFGTEVSSDEATQAIQRIKTRYPDVLIAIDHEGGAVQRFSGEGFQRLPSWQELCKKDEPEIMALTASTAAELKAVGVDIVFAPVLDIVPQGIKSPLGSRACSPEPTVVFRQAEIFARALEEQQIVPVFKHFPGIGQAKRDLHTSFDTLTVEPDEVLLYRLVLDKFPTAGVMVSHVGVINQEKDVPCSLSIHCVSQLSQSYPKALIFSDALEMESAGFIATASGTTKSLSQRASEALVAGNQVLVFGPSVTVEQLNDLIVELESQYEQSELFKATVDSRYDELQMWLKPKE